MKKLIFIFFLIIFFPILTFTENLSIEPPDKLYLEAPIGKKYHSSGFDIINNTEKELNLFIKADATDFKLSPSINNLTIKPGEDKKKPINLIIESDSNLNEGNYEGKIKIYIGDKLEKEYIIICSFKKQISSTEIEKVKVNETTIIKYIPIMIVIGAIILVIGVIVIFLVIKLKKKIPSFLVLTFNDKSTKEYKIENKITIGRDKNNNIQINDMRVSEFHASIYKEGKNVIFEDLKSTNGSFINGKQINGKIPVFANDIILIAEYEILLKK